MTSANQLWFGVRTVYEVFGRGDRLYEERITLWQAATLDEAIDLAVSEAHAYVDESDGAFEYLGMAQGFATYLPSGPLASGGEVFSLMRESLLDQDAYLTTFFDTGNERQTRDT